jgi:large subunit ribosomal protein L25
MEEIFLDAEIREGIGRSKVKDVREAGFIPAVVYSEGKLTKVLKVSHRQLVRLVHQHRLENAVINLKIKEDGKEKSRSCLIKEIQYHPVSEEILHVDFNEISLTKVIKINVPVVAKGDPIGVKQEGGSLEHILWEIEVECLPTDIPKEIEVDVSNLKIGDSIHIKDITFPPKIKVLHEPETVLLSVAAPIKEEVAAEPLEGEEKKEPEVIKEKKEAPAEEGAEEGKEKK